MPITLSCGVESKWQHGVVRQNEREIGLALPNFHELLFDTEDIQKFTRAIYEYKKEAVI